jgi:hypothetical protein
MPPPARVTLLVVAFVFALAAWPSWASAELTLTGATLNGATSVSTPPGGVFQARVTGTVTQSTKWRATTVGGGAEPTCADHGDRDDSGSVTFNITAPGTPGSYDTDFTADANNNCSGKESNTLTLADAIRVTEPGANPNLPPRCGINVMLVLDESGSVKPFADTVRGAARAFLTALSGTGAAVSIVDFSTSAARPVGYTTVTVGSIANVFEPYLTNGYSPNGFTNWEAAFQEVREANTQGTRADLVVFITDGDPTARNNPPNPPITGLVEGDATALRRAAIEADSVKGAGLARLRARGRLGRDGRRQRQPPDRDLRVRPVPRQFGKADYTLVQKFADLA